MDDSRRISFILEELCGELGFCSAARTPERFAAIVDQGIDAFTDAVLDAEGGGPELAKRSRASIRDCVARHYATWHKTGDAIRGLVEAEIDGQWDRPTSHGLDLRQSILPAPRKIVLHFDSRGPDAVRDAWLVLIEHPGDESGYWVFYDPGDRAFGLASKGSDGRFHHVGTYGSLWKTLEGM